jgi:hypothetical protein
LDAVTLFVHGASKMSEFVGTTTQPVIAERELTCIGATRRVTIRVYAPEPEPEPDADDLPWRCAFIVTGLPEVITADDDEVVFAIGRDSFEALSGALQGARSCLDRASEKVGLEFSWPAEGWHTVPHWVPVYWGRRAERRLLDAMIREETLMFKDRIGLEPPPRRELTAEQIAYLLGDHHNDGDEPSK